VPGIINYQSKTNVRSGLPILPNQVNSPVIDFVSVPWRVMQKMVQVRIPASNSAFSDYCDVFSVTFTEQTGGVRPKMSTLSGVPEEIVEPGTILFQTIRKGFWHCL
jgi:hypothetical protein